MNIPMKLRTPPASSVASGVFLDTTFFLILFKYLSSNYLVLISSMKVGLNSTLANTTPFSKLPNYMNLDSSAWISLDKVNLNIPK